jgi:hypothetical protein
MAHAPNPSTYLDTDDSTSGHEVTHYINSVLRQRYLGWSCYYIEDDTFGGLPNIKGLTLSTIAQQTPLSIRGSIYKLYLLDAQQWWNNEPEYVLDELSAYIYGSIVAWENGYKDRFAESFDHALETMGYSLVLVQNLPQDYNSQNFRAILEFQVERCIYLYREADKRNWLDSRHYKMLYNLQNSMDTAALRSFCLRFFGKDWCRFNLGLK